MDIEYSIAPPSMKAADRPKPTTDVIKNYYIQIQRYSASQALLDKKTSR